MFVDRIQCWIHQQLYGRDGLLACLVLRTCANSRERHASHSDGGCGPRRRIHGHDDRDNDHQFYRRFGYRHRLCLLRDGRQHESAGAYRDHRQLLYRRRRLCALDFGQSDVASGWKRAPRRGRVIHDLAVGRLRWRRSRRPITSTAFGPPQVITEGCNCIISGNGPGPYIFSNTYMNATGLPMHYDDGGGPPLLPRGDYTITRNYFNTPALRKRMAGGPSSNGLWYGNRQPIEWKGGQRIILDGNIFNGCFEQINPVGVCSAVTPRSGGYVTDVAMTNNSYLNSTGRHESTEPD